MLGYTHEKKVHSLQWVGSIGMASKNAVFVTRVKTRSLNILIYPALDVWHKRQPLDSQDSHKYIFKKMNVGT